MGIDAVSSPIDVAVSGLRAEAMRLRVISNNIANANTTRTEAGTPYRRQSVVLASDGDGLGGVRVERVEADARTPFKRVYEPGSPEADSQGFLSMPNVDLPMEMVQLVAASRSYQANAAVLKRYQDVVNVAIELLR